MKSDGQQNLPDPAPATRSHLSTLTKSTPCHRPCLCSRRSSAFTTLFPFQENSYTIITTQLKYPFYGDYASHLLQVSTQWLMEKALCEQEPGRCGWWEPGLQWACTDVLP